MAEAKVGDVVKGVLKIVVPTERRMVTIEDYIPAGFELVNFDLATEDATTITGNRYAPGLGMNDRGLIASLRKVFTASVGAVEDNEEYVDQLSPKHLLYPDFRELRDDKLFLFKERLAPGTYLYEYYLRATTPGTFSHLPAIVQELYFPENFGRTGGGKFLITQ
jgi:uncharacterized protein YfaS (alpha-2-macroglobulin family)